MSATILTTAYLVIGNLVLAGFLIELLRRADAAPRLLWATAAGLVAWMGALTWAVVQGRLFPPDLSGTTFFSILLAVVAAVSAGFLLMPGLSVALARAPQELLLLPQGLRAFFGAGFLAQAALGVMPAYFGIADGLTHVTAAFLAMKAGLLWGRGEESRGMLWFANLFGLLDIVMVAIGISFVMLRDITPNHNVMLAAFFAAPIFIALHAVSLAKLLRTSSSAPAGVRTVPARA